MQIIKDTTLAEILKTEGAEKILAKYNVPCLSCPSAASEIKMLKIGEVCEAYNINCEKLIKELNL